MFGLVSKKKYNLLKENYKKINEQRIEAEKENNKLRVQLNSNFALIELYESNCKKAIKCEKCGYYYIPRTQRQKFCTNCSKSKTKKGVK